MDYGKLAKQFGGSTMSTTTKPTVDYSSLAKKFGGASVAPEPVATKPKNNGIFSMSTLKGEPSYRASEGGANTILPNLAKTAANIPSSAVSLARGMVVDPVINTVKAPIEAVKLVKEQGVKKGFNLFAQGFADTVNKGVDAYKKVGEVIYNNLEKNVVAENSVVKGLRTSANEGTDKVVTTIAKTGIEDPLLLPSLLYAPGKLKGVKGEDTITTIAKPFVNNPVVNKTKEVVNDISIARKEAKVAKIIAKRSDEIAKIEGTYSNTRKANEFSKDAGAASRQRVAETDVLVNSVDENGLIRTKGKGGAIDQYEKMTIGEAEGVVRKGLEKEGASVDAKKLTEKLKSSVENDPLIKGDAKTQALAKVDKEVAAYKRNPDGRIPLTEIHDAKIATTKTIKDFATPAEYKTYQKALARGLKEAVEESSSLNIKERNSVLSKYLEDIKLLERLDGKRVKGGKLGKYFAQISGNIVGGVAGGVVGGMPGSAIGTIVGGELAGRIKGSLLSKTLGKGTGTQAPKSTILEKAVADNKKPLLGLPAAQKGAPQTRFGSNGVIPIAPKGSKMEFTGKDYSNSLGNRNTKYNTTNTPNITANITPSVTQLPKRTFIDMLKSNKGSVSMRNPFYKDTQGVKMTTELKDAVSKELAGYDNKPLTVRMGNNARAIPDDIKDTRIAELQRKIETKSLNDQEYKEAYELLKAKGIDVAKPKPTLKSTVFKQNSTTGKLEGSIPATESKLIQEAKKYKSAEQLKGNYKNPLYHDTTAGGIKGILTDGQIDTAYVPFGGEKSVSFTANPENYSRMKAPFRIIVDDTKKSATFMNDIEAEHVFRNPVPLKDIKEIAIDFSNPYILDSVKNGDIQKIINLAKEKGIKITPFESNRFGGGELEQLTKSQLTDIWNKAKKSAQIAPNMQK